jgi:kumamolisin
MRPFAARQAALARKRARPHYLPLSGSEIDPLPNAYVVGSPKLSRRIDVTVLLRPRVAQGALPSLYELAAKPPAERQHLSRASYRATHGADPVDVRRIVRFARRHNLTFIGHHPAARTVHLRGTVANFSRAFRVSLCVYRHPRGIYRGRTGPIYVPAALQGVIRGVFGLDNRPVAHPHFRRKRQLGGAWPHAQDIGYSPVEVAQLYSFPTGGNGAGQCIGIIELGGGYTVTDLNTYFKNLGVPAPQVVAVPVAGGSNKPTGDPNGPDGEVMLDIEVAGAVAPGAKLAVYFAPNTNQGFLRAINRAIHDQVNKPSVISISWGGPEASYTKQALNAFDQAFQAAGLLGVTICVAAGDDGSSDGVPGRHAHVDFPASSPHVIACGGTSLKASGTSIISETVWNDGPGGGAGGGGISDFWPLPSYQTNANIPPSVNGGRIGRGLPDLAGDADENTGYNVRVDGLNTVIGGTSAVAPLTAALIALLNEKLSAPVGYLNPLLYSTIGNAGAFRDITQGNNDMTGLVGGYKAAAGWDACSGFGSPIGTAILTALEGASKAQAAGTGASVSGPATAAAGASAGAGGESGAAAPPPWSSGASSGAESASGGTGPSTSASGAGAGSTSASSSSTSATKEEEPGSSKPARDKKSSAGSSGS